MERHHPAPGVGEGHRFAAGVRCEAGTRGVGPAGAESQLSHRLAAVLADQSQVPAGTCDDQIQMTHDQFTLVQIDQQLAEVSERQAPHGAMGGQVPGRGHGRLLSWTDWTAGLRGSDERQAAGGV